MRSVGSRRSVASVLLVGLDGDAMGMVRETLAAEAVLPNSSISFGDAIGTVKRNKPDVVIVGMEPSQDAALALAQALTKEAPSVSLVALASSSNAEIILAAMRVGYKEFVVLPNDAPRLRQVVHEAAYATTDEEEKGTVITICGAKGGVGTTLISTHLAAELAAIHRVICIDMDFAMGDAGTLLDVSSKDSIIDVLHNAENLDDRALTGSVAVHRSKVHVLTQPTELDKITEVNPDDVYNIIATAANGYQYVLMDIGVKTDDIANMCLSVADHILLVTTPDVVAVRDAFRRLKLLESLGIEKDRVKLVVNRHRKGAFVSNEDIQANLQVMVSATVTDDPKAVDAAINEGKLLREVNRKADIAQDISAMVAMLTEDLEEEDEEEGDDEPSGGGKGGFFSSLFGRG